jgi:hypothetical protein
VALLLELEVLMTLTLLVTVTAFCALAEALDEAELRALEIDWAAAMPSNDIPELPPPPPPPPTSVTPTPPDP